MIAKIREYLIQLILGGIDAAAIRQSAIEAEAAKVAADIEANGLTDEDKAVIDAWASANL